ncbi:MAG: indolepyruvate ferredoxin oxidoreductase family protein [Geminicoccaceae bacterium]
MTQLLEVALDDKYTKTDGRIFVTGIQALVRLPLVQRQRDLAAGLNTAGFITGYRGSPLGTYDQQLARAKAHLDAHHIVHRPAVNEDLAATACSGTQQVGLDGESRYDGVFAIWYAKGPGVDRSGDAIRHGNLFGTAARGGVLMLLGDDHICESSTTAHQSEYAMVDALVPVLNPAGVQEILEYGLIGIAMSRFTGGWVALKCIHDTVESTASIGVDPHLPEIRLPGDFPMPSGGLSIRWPDNGIGQRMALAQEARVHTHKLDAARAFARANRLDRVVVGGGGAWFGIVTTGKSWLDVIAALDDLGIDDARASELGLLVYKVGMVWPLEPRALEEAVGGLERVLVVEEKRGLIEGQAKELLYHLPTRPDIEGKVDLAGAPLLPSHGSLSSNQVAIAIAERLLERRDDRVLRARLEELRRAERAAAGYVPALARLPYFCPGCPHSSSTHVPEGSKALAGIGCHFMVQWMDRDTRRFTQMGGEGASWVGEAPFSTRPHIFQNVGDGTFYHSGSLAIRAAQASGANITFKILYNDAVAMTGGQKMETGNLDVPAITRLLEAEGVPEIVVVTDEPDKYPLGAGFAHGVRVHPRSELDAVQRRLREVPGVSALVYDQTCAAEKRRRRKHGGYPDPDERVVINELVCEGCGDCGVVSNCVAIQPAETEFGRKRRIDQSACNKDFSCLDGFCPSFVTVKGGRLRKASAPGEVPFPVLPEPDLPALDGPYGILVTGVGGTGVITVAALLGMAAHLEGKGAAALDMIGMAQKGGAVLTHMKLAPTQAEIGAPRVAAGGARLVLGCDIVVAAGAQAIPTMRRGTTAVVVNLDSSMTGDFTRAPDLPFPGERLRQAIVQAAGSSATSFLDAGRLARALVGDAIGANLLLVGYAWQKGLIPLSREAIERAIAINGVQIDFNRRAFLWGRRAAHDLAAVEAVIGARTPEPEPSLDGLIERRAEFLIAYQNAAYARRYREQVGRVREVEARRVPGRMELTEAVARNLFKLMAIKDEYEVARLWTDGSFRRQLEREFEGWDALEVHLAPPLLAETDSKGRLTKRRYRPWMLRAMRITARLKRLRGTAFDLFGRTAERRMERQLLANYESLLDVICRDLGPANQAAAVELARVPEQIRGFGHVKAANVERAKANEARLLEAWRHESALQQAAE